MRTLAHEEARISFEGRLSHTELAKIAGASLTETEVLKRNTTSPRLDFVVLPLTQDTVPEIQKAIVSKIAFKDYAGIVHVQIVFTCRLKDRAVWHSSHVTSFTKIVSGCRKLYATPFWPSW